MLGDGSDALDLVCVGHVEGLNATVVEDVPKLDHTLRVSRDEAVKVWKAVNANQWVLMTIESHDGHLHVRVPDEDIKIETATYQHLVLITVRHLTNGSIVAFQRLNGRDSQVAENLLIHLLVLEVRLNLILHCFLGGLLFRVKSHGVLIII